MNTKSRGCLIFMLATLLASALLSACSTPTAKNQDALDKRGGEMPPKKAEIEGGKRVAVLFLRPAPTYNYDIDLKRFEDSSFFTLFAPPIYFNSDDYNALIKREKAKADRGRRIRNNIVQSGPYEAFEQEFSRHFRSSVNASLVQLSVPACAAPLSEADLARALEAARAQNCDVLILVRSRPFYTDDSFSKHIKSYARIDAKVVAVRVSNSKKLWSTQAFCSSRQVPYTGYESFKVLAQNAASKVVHQYFSPPPPKRTQRDREGRLIVHFLE